jgi:hypothetical protein
VKEKWLGRLDGRHFTAAVRLSLDRDGKHEERRIQVWRDDVGEERERLMARFEEPPDLRGLGLLYLENRGRPNDYFLYQPSLRRVRRIAESVVRADVYGIDLEYLGFGLALIEPADIAEVQIVALGARHVIRLTEVAQRQNQRFEKRIVWLDPDSFVPLRTEHWRQGKVSLLAQTQEIRIVQGVPTPAHVVFTRPLDRESVIMVVEAVDYQMPIPSDFFSTFTLVKE